MFVLNEMNQRSLRCEFPVTSPLVGVSPLGRAPLLAVAGGPFVFFPSFIWILMFC